MQLPRLRELLNNPNVSDETLQFYLDSGSDIICDIRNSNKVESKYLTTQIRIAIELFNKRGAEGQISHTEGDIERGYSKSDISEDLLNQITPVAKTPFSEVRVIE